MNPQPAMATRIGLPCFARSFRSVSTYIIMVYGLPLSATSGQLGILVGDHRDRQRPRDAEFRVIESVSILAGRRMRSAHLIDDLGVVDERLEAVCNIWRKVQRAVILGCEFHHHMLAVGCRIGPNVDRDVHDRAPGAPNSLRFPIRGYLQMQAPQRPRLVVVRDVALHHVGIESVLSEFGGAERPREEAAIVDVWCEVDDRHAVDLGRGELQLGPSRIVARRAGRSSGDTRSA